MCHGYFQTNTYFLQNDRLDIEIWEVRKFLISWYKNRDFLWLYQYSSDISTMVFRGYINILLSKE